MNMIEMSDMGIGQRVRVVGLPSHCRVADGWPANGTIGQILDIDDDCEDAWIQFDESRGKQFPMGGMWIDWQYLERVQGREKGSE
jgi:hypothetical protein